ncbi:hypothetical protein M8C21_003509 [Ambrosia artemisiifolia]|uniref:Uncharacterized protein n=1 Tax=Ambrosia artemisiifolia TaxID=4212 RepID=A0AAD5CPF7_AMBAR|nr:hypothetical protein M8C21_003509 [Ambrosia artemisiifolia]
MVRVETKTKGGRSGLEFLSVAQNKLKSLSMASQPRLQVLAASKNKASTLKGFPSLPSLEELYFYLQRLICTIMQDDMI